MALELSWVTSDARDEIATARLAAYGNGPSGLEAMQQAVPDDRAPGHDYLLARDEAGRPIGTATSYAMQMWVRGAALPCQGVAWVGTARTHRRSSKRFGGKGVATHLMEEMIRRGRERGDAVTALHPFRGSFYEEFGYGVIERRVEWNIPIRTLPAGATDGLRFLEPADQPEMAACLARAVAAGQCDIARSPGRWAKLLHAWRDGWTIVDRPKTGGPVRGYMHFVTNEADPQHAATVTELVYENTPALVRQLRFLATLRDQYSRAVITLPGDLPLNLLLREPQVVLDPSSEGPASVRTHNRLMVRVLDHKRLLESIAWPGWAKGRTVIGIQESEGRLTRVAVDVEAGRATVTLGSEATPEAAISDNTWAQIVLGELTATRAVRLGLIAVESAHCLEILDALAKGPVPFCHEQF
ncbi:MAG TPA: GNAT family N-acetyltransferase [Tepidisphaeraceae bacterium]|jgi:predicted acetyltransferase|nr:GNAT family N-acetyltransferase [Tepidisphaeraceae bacterium]